jgi:hypothetical protein
VYRLNALGAGEYFIAARPSTGGQAWGRTFYPSTPDPLTVAPLRISDKSAFRGIDIRVQNMQTFAVRGRAFNPLLQGPPRRFPNGDLDTSVQAFSIVPRNPDLTEPAITIQNAATAEQARRNGDFEIRGIRPGLYDVFPVITSTIDGEIRYASGRIPVEIRERDVDGLVISISAGIDVRGHITVNGDASLLQNRTLRVSLRALDNIPQPIVDRLGSPRVESNGSFAIKHVPEALYSLVAGPLPPNIYVADIRQRGVSVFDNGFPVGSDAVAPLEVLLNTDAQALEGNVIDTKQNAVPQAWIVLVPNSRRQNPSLYRTGTSDKEGRFKIPNVPPGEYIAFASKSFPGPFWLNPDFLARYEARGERVSVKAGSTAALRLKAIER